MVDVIEVVGLRKQYRDVLAVDDVSFTVGAGEIFGMIGPNGAGKTTTIECVEGLRRADAGTVRVLGLDPVRDRYAVRERIGIQLQSAAVQDRLRVGEAISLYASLYERPTDVHALMSMLELADLARRPFSKLSGGQQQRLFIALALVGDPEVLFLDELTTGLDPHARRGVWEIVRRIRATGKTIVLSTHFMDEAQSLCDRVAVLEAGRVVACDTPSALMARCGASSLEESYLELTKGARWT